mmetsp:Transcript_4598/g.6600  ORF Transcript_4598/g.6600 Transcript_4598/m.6600 type:complete len:84 (-) Transcript_4598:1481-1732(-)
MSKNGGEIGGITGINNMSINPKFGLADKKAFHTSIRILDRIPILDHKRSIRQSNGAGIALTMEKKVPHNTTKEVQADIYIYSK